MFLSQNLKIKYGFSTSLLLPKFNKVNKINLDPDKNWENLVTPKVPCNL